MMQASATQLRNDRADPIMGYRFRLPAQKQLSDEAYWAFCMANPHLRLERTAGGEIVIVPPAGGESDYRNTKAVIGLGILAAFGLAMAFIHPANHGASTSSPMVNDSARHTNNLNNAPGQTTGQAPATSAN